MMLTVFLRHDQSKTFGEIRAQLEREDFFQKFPPAGTEVVSWYVMMGVGQVGNPSLSARSPRPSGGRASGDAPRSASRALRRRESVTWAAAGAVPRDPGGERAVSGGIRQRGVLDSVPPGEPPWDRSAAHLEVRSSSLASD